ncbi:MAG: response regulator [Gammaproteobacteria bacterium]|nr:response regulator [Gammaproteobacteria bacterium]
MAKIMVVDDSPTDKEQLKLVLSRAGYEVLEAGSGADAIELVHRFKPDCIVMDVVMPGINGFQATRTLARDPDTANIPIIVVSAKDQETDRLWAMRQGARAYIVKPVKESDLIEKVNAALGG